MFPKRLWVYLLPFILSLFAFPLHANTLPPLTAQFTGTDMGPHVLLLQHYLQAAGLYPTSTTPSSHYDALTTEAVTRFQQKYNLPTTPETLGFAGPITRAKLTALYGSSTSVFSLGSSTSTSSELAAQLRLQLLTLLRQLLVLLQGQLAQVSGLPLSAVQSASGGEGGSRGGSSTASTSPSGATGSGGVTIPPSSTSQPGHLFLTPGSGWVGPTPLPPATGNSTQAGYDAKAIARWDVVPYQTFDTTINIGVVAFHMNDIDYVAFSANNGPWVNVSQMTLNPETNVVEYWATLRAQDFADGPLEVRAIAVPKVGVARVLGGAITNATSGNGEHSMWLYANARDTQTGSTVYVSLTTGLDTNNGSMMAPYATIPAAIHKTPNVEKVILLSAGIYLVDYDVEAVRRPFLLNDHWITVEPAAGLARDEVIIAEKLGRTLLQRNARLHWKNVTFDFGKMVQYDPGREWWVWFDQVTWTSSQGWGVDALAQPINYWRAGAYITDSTVTDMCYGFVGATLVRNVFANKISCDVYQGNATLINAEVKKATQVLAHHGNILQYWGTVDNVIIYGLKAVSDIKGIELNRLSPITSNGEKFSNMAFVNVTMINEAIERNGDPNFGSPPPTDIEGSQTHILFLNYHQPNQRINLITLANSRSPLNAKNVIFRDCELNPHTGGYFSAPPAGVTFERCTAGDSAPASPPPTTPPTTPPATPSTPPASNANTNGLVLYLSFDGQIQDESGNNLNVTAAGNPTYTTGKSGQALTFDGVDDRVTVGDTSLLDFGTGPYTISIWVKPETPAVTNRTITKRASGNWFALDTSMGTNPNAFFATGGTTNYLNTQASYGTFSTWHHVVAVRDAAGCKSLYLDGTLSDSGECENPILELSNSADLMIGYWSTNLYKGLIDEIRIYNRTLSSSEIQSLSLP